jgi:predicted outer membrane repeat protein
MRNGDVADHGGAIYSDEELSVVDCRIENSSAQLNGGGIYSTGLAGQGSLTLTATLLTSNSANLGGGAIYSQGVELVLQDSSVTANTSVRTGGGIHVDRAALTIQGGEFRENSVIGDDRPRGGGVYVFNAAVPPSAIKISDVEFTRNSVAGVQESRGQGGGLHCEGSATTAGWPVLEVTSVAMALNRSDGVRARRRTVLFRQCVQSD